MARPRKQETAAEWLIAFLRRGTGRQRASMIFTVGKLRGFSRRTLMRAKKELGIKSWPARGGWKLPRFWYLDYLTRLHIRPSPSRRKLHIDKQR